MLGTIEKIHETTIAGEGSQYSSILLAGNCAAPLTELGIASASYSRMNGKYRLVRGDNEPHHYDIVFVVAGKLELETSTGDFIINPGDFAIIPSWNSRRLELVEGDFYLEIYFKVFESTVQEILKLNEVRVIPAPEIKFLEAAVQGYLHESVNGMDENMAAEHYAALIATYLKRQMSMLKTSVKNQGYSRLEGVRNAVCKHPELAWSVDELAAEAHVSPSHFYQLAKKSFGMTPQQMVSEERIKAAKRLLVATDLSLSQIAEKVGYSNAYGFSQAFYRNTGLRPGRFRKEERS